MAAGASRGTLERSESLDVMSVGEEVEEVERGQAPAGRGQPARVAGESYRIAGQEANHRARLLRHGVDNVVARAGARRIEEDEIGRRHPVRVLLDRRVYELDVRRDVAPRVFDSHARALDG